MQIDTVDFRFRASVQLKAAWHAPPWRHGHGANTLDPKKAADFHQQVSIEEGDTWPDPDLWGPDPQVGTSAPGLGSPATSAPGRLGSPTQTCGGRWPDPPVERHARVLGPARSGEHGRSQGEGEYPRAGGSDSVWGVCA